MRGRRRERLARSAETEKVPRSAGRVQEFEFCREVANRVVGKLNRWQIAPLLDVNSEHFWKGCVPDGNDIAKRGE